MKRCLISGLPGAGKSTLLKKCQPWLEALGWSCLDLDHVIERAHGRTCRELIETFGFEEFRKLEREHFFELEQSKQPIFLALGGGTIGEALSPEEINPDWLVIELETKIDRVIGFLQQIHHPLVAKDFDRLNSRLADRILAIKKRANHCYPSPQNEREYHQLTVAITNLLR